MTATKTKPVVWWDRHRKVRGHELMSAQAGEAIPPLYGTQDTEPYDKVLVRAKMFSIVADWRWFITEWDHKTGECFGLVAGFEMELGYFSLTELSEIQWPVNSIGCAPDIDRDLHWQPVTLGEVRKRLAKERMA